MPRKSKRVAKTGTGFIGFGGGASSSAAGASSSPSHSSRGGGASSSVSLVHSSAIQALDPSIVVVFRKLGKRDATTRTKGLKTIARIFARPEAYNTSINDTLLKAWGEAYLKLYIDPSRSVRVQLNTTLGTVVNGAGPQLAKILKTLMGPWLCALSDTATEVAGAARNAFEAAFSPAKRPQVMKFTAKSVIPFLEDNLSLDLETLLALHACSRSEGKTRLVALKAASLGALAQFITHADPATRDRVNIAAFVATHVTDDLVSFLATARDPPGHGLAALFRLFKALAAFVPDTLPTAVLPHAAILLRAFGSAPLFTLSSMWDAVLALLRADASATIDAVPMTAFVAAAVDHIADGPAEITFSCLLPLASMVPFELMTPVLDALAVRVAAGSERVATSYAELAAYGLAHDALDDDLAFLVPLLTWVVGPGDAVLSKAPDAPFLRAFRAVLRGVSRPERASAWTALLSSWGAESLASLGSCETATEVMLLLADDPAVGNALSPWGAAITRAAVAVSGANVSVCASILTRVIGTGVIELDELDPVVRDGTWLWGPFETVCGSAGAVAAMQMYASAFRVYGADVTPKLLSATGSHMNAWAEYLGAAGQEVLAAAAAAVTAELPGRVAEPGADRVAKVMCPVLDDATVHACLDAAIEATSGAAVGMCSGALTVAEAEAVVLVTVGVINAAFGDDHHAVIQNMSEASVNKAMRAVFWFSASQDSHVAGRVALAWERLSLRHGLADDLVEELMNELWDAFHKAVRARAAELELPHTVPDGAWMSTFSAATLVFVLVASTRSKAVLDIFASRVTAWPEPALLDALEPFGSGTDRYSERLSGPAFPMEPQTYTRGAEAYVVLSWHLVMIAQLVRMASFGLTISAASDRMVLGPRYLRVLALAGLHGRVAHSFEEVGTRLAEVEPQPLSLTGPGTRQDRRPIVGGSDTDDRAAADAGDAGDADDNDDAASVGSLASHDMMSLPETPDTTCAELVALFVAEWGLSQSHEHDVHADVVPVDAQYGDMVDALVAVMSGSEPTMTDAEVAAHGFVLAQLLSLAVDAPDKTKDTERAVAAFAGTPDAVVDALDSVGGTAGLVAVAGTLSETLDAAAWQARLGAPLFDALVAGSARAAAVLEHGVFTSSMSDHLVSSMRDSALRFIDSKDVVGTLSGALVGTLTTTLGDFALLGIQHERVRTAVASSWKGVARYVRYARRVGEDSAPEFVAWAQARVRSVLNELRVMRKAADELEALAYVGRVNEMLLAVNALLPPVQTEEAVAGSLVGRMAWADALDLAKRADSLLGIHKDEDVEDTDSVAGFEILKAVYRVRARLVKGLCVRGDARVDVMRGAVSRFVSGAQAWASGARVSILGQLLGWQSVLDHGRGALGTTRQTQHVIQVLTVFGNSLNVTLSLAFGALSGGMSEAQAGAFDFAISADEVEPQTDSLLEFAGRLFVDTIKIAPKAVRRWWDGVSRNQHDAIRAFVVRHISPKLIREALDEVTELPDVKVAHGLRTVKATYEVDEVGVELALHLPESYPLEPVVIDEDTAHRGVSSSQWRRWVLSLRTMLQSKLASLAQVVSHWRATVSSHFDGAEECAICYYILHFDDHSLPSMECGVCHQKFHSACLLGWFDTSQASTCPLCRSPF